MSMSCEELKVMVEEAKRHLEDCFECREWMDKETTTDGVCLRQEDEK